MDVVYSGISFNKWYQHVFKNRAYFAEYNMHKVTQIEFIMQYSNAPHYFLSCTHEQKIVDEILNPEIYDKRIARKGYKGDGTHFSF